MMKNRFFLGSSSLVTLLLLFGGCQSNISDTIEIDGKSIGDKVPESLYGVFFEEISHSGDGGIYAEMIQNRGFEDGTLPSGTVLKDGYACASHSHCYSNDSINQFKVKWNKDKFMNAWEVVSENNEDEYYSISTDYPLHTSTPHSLYLNLKQSKSPLSVINHGYWGISVEENKKYLLKFWMKSSASAPDVVNVSIKDKSGVSVCSAKVNLINNNKWNCYQLDMIAEKTEKNCVLSIDLTNKGDVYLDYVKII